MGLLKGSVALAFALILPGYLATFLFFPNGGHWRRLVLGSLFGTFCFPFFFFGLAILFRTVISVRLVIGVAFFLNLDLAILILVTRKCLRKGTRTSIRHSG